MGSRLRLTEQELVAWKVGLLSRAVPPAPTAEVLPTWRKKPAGDTGKGLSGAGPGVRAQDAVFLAQP